MGKSKRYPVEVRERAVRLVREQQGEYETEWAAICSISGEFHRIRFVFDRSALDEASVTNDRSALRTA